jgi:predicted transcriptional regulator
MDLTDKIKQILVDKNITPSLFADEIGIQRSSMSHILAGRNKPSLDMVQKIVKRFPDLGIHWILDDGPLPVTAPAPVQEEALESRKKATSRATARSGKCRKGETGRFTRKEDRKSAYFLF